MRRREHSPLFARSLTSTLNASPPLLPPAARTQEPPGRPADEVALQNVIFAESSTPITVGAGWRLYVAVRTDPACATDVDNISGLTTWAAAIHLSSPGTSNTRTFLTDDSWELNVETAGAYVPTRRWEGPVKHDGHVPDDARWLTHVPHVGILNNFWSLFRFTFPNSVCDGLPTAAEVAAVDAAAAAEAAARARAEASRASGGAGGSGAWTTAPIAVAAALGTTAATASAVAAAVAARLLAERRRGLVGGAPGGGQEGRDSTAVS